MAVKPKRLNPRGEIEALATLVYKCARLDLLPQRERERWQRAEDRQERDRLAARTATLRKNANVPALFESAVLGDTSYLLEVPKGYLGFCRYLASSVGEPRTVAAVGQYGTGKTDLGFGLVNLFCASGRTARYEKLVNFFTDVRDAMGKHVLRDCLNRYRSYDCLVLDEITVRTDSAWDEVLFRDLIDERHNNLKTTLLMGNATAADVSALLGDPMVRRMNTFGGVFEIPWGPLKYKPRPRHERPDAA